MKTGRILLALPFVWVAAISAAACSSSNGAHSDVDGGGGSAECSALEACCQMMGTSSPGFAGCVAAVNAGGVTCTDTLMSLTAQGGCAPHSSSSGQTSASTNQQTTVKSTTSSEQSTKTTTTSGESSGSTSESSGSSHDKSSGGSSSSQASTSSGSSSHHSSSHHGSSSESSATETTSNSMTESGTTESSSTESSTAESSSSSHHGSSNQSHSSVSSSGSSGSSGSSNGGTCAVPPSVLTGFVPPTGVYGTGCTATNVEQYAACEANPYNAGDPRCWNALTLDAPDGDFNACGTCVYGTVLMPLVNPPPTWGLEVIVELAGTPGDTSTQWEANLGPDIGACIYAAGGTAAHQCGLDLMAADSCAEIICSSLCPVPNPGSGSVNQADFQAFEACESATFAAGAACGSYYSAAVTDCASFDSVYATCSKLINEYNDNTQGADFDPDAGPATVQGVSQLLELTCGGGDAGV